MNPPGNKFKAVAPIKLSLNLDDQIFAIGVPRRLASNSLRQAGHIAGDATLSGSIRANDKDLAGIAAGHPIEGN